MQPLYFLPNVEFKRELTPAAKREVLKAHGIADVFADVAPEEIGCNVMPGTGPGELSGTIIFYSSPETNLPRRCGYYPSEQTWQQVDDGSLLWIGLDNASPPTPADLERKKVFKGYRLELGDGREWEIPVIRRPTDEASSLPMRQYIERGKLMTSIKAAYREYWDESAEVAEWFFSPDKKEMNSLRLHSLCVRALSLNYRFGHNEQKLMDVVDGENWMTILACTVDRPGVLDYQESQKKSDLQGASVSS